MSQSHAIIIISRFVTESSGNFLSQTQQTATICSTKLQVSFGCNISMRLGWFSRLLHPLLHVHEETGSTLEWDEIHQMFNGRFTQNVLSAIQDHRLYLLLFQMVLISTSSAADSHPTTYVHSPPVSSHRCPSWHC